MTAWHRTYLVNQVDTLCTCDILILAWMARVLPALPTSTSYLRSRLRSFSANAHGWVVGRRLSAGGRRYYHTDLLGSTRTVVDSLNVVKEAYDYDPWGVLMPGRTLGSGTKEGFTGKERDAETGLDYFGFRYYMAAIGRWTTVDPPADEFPEWSPYNYVENNPINFWDPFGLCPQYLTGRPCNNVLGGAAMNVRASAANPRVGQFGMVRNGGTRPHQGLDILAQVGSPVTAADGGTVVFAGSAGAHGNHIILAHQNADGNTVSYTAYSHLDAIGVSVGDVVDASQQIGTTGKTGNADNPAIPAHLHFEIRTANPPGPGLNNRIDPKPELKP
jgi:RHS repeat-associated protein